MTPTRLAPLVRDLALHSRDPVRADNAIILAERLDGLVMTMLEQIDFLFMEVSARDRRIAALEQEIAMVDIANGEGIASR